MQNMPNSNAKGHVSAYKRCSLEAQKSIFYNALVINMLQHQAEHIYPYMSV